MIIALAGPKGVGKSTMAHHLLINPNISQGAGILSFAGGLKLMLSTILPKEAFTPEGKEDVNFGLCGKTPRYLMQTLGTEWGRNLVGEDIWVGVMEHRIKTGGLGTVIIDDLRFENEWAMVKRLGGIVINLERSGVSHTCEHKSEQPLDAHLFDSVVNLDKVDDNFLRTIFNPFH
jgi:hypothetical protein